MKDTKLPQHVRYFVIFRPLLWLCCLAPLTTLGQGAADEEDRTVFDLSPFQVIAGDNVGYLATTSLSGTRIRTDLRDLGAAITVITPEFIRDTGATGIDDLLVFTTGTEVGGAFGNFTGSSIGAARARQESSRENPEGNTRVRGLVSAELSRDYFITDFGFDTFNVERVDISRGPNAVLFGVGSPGGVINYSLKRANLYRDMNEIGFRLGPHGSLRGTADFNRMIVKDRLALRLNFLEDQTRYRQKPASRDDQRIFAALESVLHEGRQNGFLGSTVLRGNFEKASVDSVPVNVIAPVDAIRDWYLIPDVAAIEGQTGQKAPSRYTDGTFVPQSMHDRLGANAPFRGSLSQRLPWFIAIGQVFTDPTGGAAPRVGFTDSALSSLQATQGRIVGSFDWLAQSSLADETWTSGFVGRTFQGPQIYDFERQLITGKLENTQTDFKHGTVVLEQLLLDRNAGIELAYNFQNLNRRIDFPISKSLVPQHRSFEVMVDNNLWYGNGQPNPNAGRAMIVSRDWGNYTLNSIDRETLRATGFLRLNARDRFSNGLLSMLGRHNFSGLLERNTRDSLSRNMRMAVSSDEINMQTALNSTIEGIRRQLSAAFYISPDLRPVSSYDQVRLNGVIDVKVPRDGDHFLTFVRDPSDNQIKNVTAYAEEYLHSGSASKRIIDSSAVTWQAYLFEDHLVALYGYRSDRVRDTLNIGNIRLPGGALDPASLLLNDVPSLDARGSTQTWSLVGHYPEKLFGPLPFGSELSLFYSKSENFEPVGFRQDVFLRSIGPPSGSTKEYGFLVTLRDRKYSVRVNWYETLNSNVAIENNLAAIATDTVRGWITRQAEARDVGIPFGFNSSGAPTGMANHFESYDQVINILLEDIIPEPIKSARNLRFSSTGIGLGSVQQDSIPGLSSTSDFVARGLEMEFVANPTNNWRLSFNVAKQETVRSGSGAELVDYYGQLRQNLVNANLWDTNILDEAAVAGSVTFKQRLLTNVLNPLAAITARDGTVSQEQRKWRFNLVSAYTFTESPLAGLQIGGALRWQDKAAVGYPLLLIETEGDTIQIPDLDNPYKTPASWNGDVFASYTMPLGNRVEWTVKLHLRNYLGDRKFRAEVINPDGSPAVIRIPVQRAIFLSNSISF